jgi:hypothetical protein
MTPSPKRIPGERNPEVDPTEVHLIQNAASSGAGSSDLAAVRAWRAAREARDRFRQWRRKRRAMAAHEASKREP